MVDFKRHLSATRPQPLDPTQIYSTLDRSSDKGPLRPVQERILRRWFADFRSKKDVVLKLQTGQGKTLIGLLALQSRQNATQTPSLYLCPNNQLVKQTLDQAKQFGISCVERRDTTLPHEFKEAKKILVTTVHSLFNGRSTFGLGNSALAVGTICMDDAHACVDRIGESFVIKLAKTEAAYGQVRDLFESSLREQGEGRWADIKLGKADVLLPVPYWAWQERISEVAGILAQHESAVDAIKFAWPLLKDQLRHCQCVVSGTSLELGPYLSPVEQFRSFSDAPHRIFMSATAVDDSLFVKDLGVDPGAVATPLVDEDEQWSGEKMILIPSRMSDELDDGALTTYVGKPVEERKYGCVVLCPSFRRAERWRVAGAAVAEAGTIDESVARLRAGECDKTVALVARYDGVDLPDDACRILVLDGLPTGESLLSRYVRQCRDQSDYLLRMTARVLEQGLGRAVRGERDYCAVILMGSRLLDAVYSLEARKYFSAQTQKQIEIGCNLVDFARKDVEAGTAPMTVLRELVGQSLRRDQGWKDYYSSQMEGLSAVAMKPAGLQLFTLERQAERALERGAPTEARGSIQKILDEFVTTPTERGWYLQQLARMTLPTSKDKSTKLQAEAQKLNRNLLRPEGGVEVVPIQGSAQLRVGQVVEFVRSAGDAQCLRARVKAIVDDVDFGVEAEAFERAFDQLGRCLGFATQRPDHDYGFGPDNLWALREGVFLLVECKSEVKLTRSEIYKDETGQLGNACAWFRRNYPGATFEARLIHPSRQLGKGAGTAEVVKVLRPKALRALRKATTAFFREFESYDFGDLDPAKVNAWLVLHKLAVDDVRNLYAEALREPND